VRGSCRRFDARDSGWHSDRSVGGQAGRIRDALFRCPRHPAASSKTAWIWYN
jgi:hypothetical protein